MNKKIQDAIEKYQCPGCVCGYNIECFKENEVGVGCGKHAAGTLVSYIGLIFLGMPRGFNRLGECHFIPRIFETFKKCSIEYNKFTVPIWKYKTKEGYTLVRGFMPRLTQPFIHLFLEDCRKEFDCLEITQKDIDKMD